MSRSNAGKHFGGIVHYAILSGCVYNDLSISIRIAAGWMDTYPGKGWQPTMARQKLVTPREAAQILGVSYPTVKQWIYKKKLKTIKTAGGHHRVPESQLDKFLHFVHQRGDVSQRRATFRRISGRNQLIGRVSSIKVDGLIAQVTVLIGGQRINAIVTTDAVREMRLKIGETIAALIKSTEVMLLRP